jgi:hypothetical protein
MATTSDRMELVSPEDADAVDVDAHWNDNYDTAITRPIWGAKHAGQVIYETDRDLFWLWDGGAFIRSMPGSLQGRSYSLRSFTAGWERPTLVLALTVPTVVGDRDLRLTATLPAMTLTIPAPATTTAGIEVTLVRNPIAADPYAPSIGGTVLSTVLVGSGEPVAMSAQVESDTTLPLDIFVLAVQATGGATQAVYDADTDFGEGGYLAVEEV